MFFLLRPAWAMVDGGSVGGGRGGGVGEEGKDEEEEGAGSEEAWMVELGLRLEQARGGEKGEAVARSRRRPE